MKLIEIYIVKQLLINSILLLLLLLSIFSLSKSVQLIELSLNQGLPVTILLQLILFSLLSIIPFILPIIFSLSIFFTFSRMKNDSELIIIESSGGSKFFMIRPVIILGSFFVILSIFFTIILSPKCNHNFRFLLNKIKNDYSSSLLQPGVFNTIGKDFTIFLKKRSTDGELQNLFIHDTRDPERPNTLISKKGYLINSNVGNKILLKNGSQQFFSQESNKLSLLYFKEYLLSFDDNNNNNSLRVWKTPSERSLNELYYPDLKNGDDLKNLQAFKAEIVQRFSLPLNIITFGFLIVSILLSQKFLRIENISYNVKILSSIIGLNLMFVVCSSIAVKLEDFEIINLFPSIISLFIGINLFKKINNKI